MLRSIKLGWISSLVVAMFSVQALIENNVRADIQLNLNDFTADTTVSVAADGSSASFTEDMSTSPVLLSNDPFLGEPNVVQPAQGRSLEFDYEFSAGGGSNNDEFGAFVFLADTGDSAGSAFEFFSSDTGSGSVSFDLSSLVGSLLGLQFQLSALPGDGGLESEVTVSNVRLVDTTSAVPEPGSYLIWGVMAAVLSAGGVRVRHSRFDD